MADAFHEAAVAGDHIGVVVDDIGPVAGGQHAFGERHADAVGDALSERAGRGFDAGCVAVFGMTGGLGAELAEVPQLLDRHAGIPGEIEERIEQHRAVAGRQDEAIAVGPLWIGRIEAQMLGEEDGCHIGHAHGHAWVARIRFLHRVHRQHADGVRHVAGADRRLHIRHSP